MVFFILIVLLVFAALFYVWRRGYLSEFLHALAVVVLRVAPSCLIPSFCPPQAESTQCMGLAFRNRLGLAAGWDKQAQCLRGLQALGFGCVEIGGVTPKPQPGNPRPRVFRLSAYRAIINRYGLNSHGVERIAKRLRTFKSKGMRIGANIAPNTLTQPADWLSDYECCLQALYPFVDYFTINLSCPNTGHRELNESLDTIEPLLQGIARISEKLALKHSIKRPLLVKVSPDWPVELLEQLVDVAISNAYSGVVAVNTTTSREAVKDHCRAGERGGLSGAPLYAANLQAIECLSALTRGRLSLVSVGGIETPEQAEALRDAGADLLQVYSGFVYQGPQILSRLL